MLLLHTMLATMADEISAIIHDIINKKGQERSNYWKG
jgi:hypothetical protein